MMLVLGTMCGPSTGDAVEPEYVLTADCQSSGFGSSATIWGGVTLLAGGGRVAAFHLDDGSLKWKRTLGVHSVDAWGDKAIAGGVGFAAVLDFSSGATMRTLMPPGAAANGQFGAAVALNGTTAFVSDPSDDTRAPNAGAVHAYDAESGAYLYTVYANDPDANDQFGNSIDTDEGFLVVGARWNNTFAINDGAAYLFDLPSGSFHLRLAVFSTAGSTFFGDSVAIEDGRVMVGAPRAGLAGMAYLYDATTGGRLRQFFPADGRSDDRFGASVAISGDRVMVGADFANVSSFDSGATYIYNRNTGIELYKFVQSTAINPQHNSDYFGQSVAIGIGAAVASAPNATPDECAWGAGFVLPLPCNPEPQAWNQHDPPWGSELYGASAPDASEELDPVLGIAQGLRDLAAAYPDPSIPVPDAELFQYLVPNFVANHVWAPDANENGVRIDSEDLLNIAENLELRRSNYSIAAVGCTLTSVAIAADIVGGAGLNPGELYEELRRVQNGWFVGFTGSVESLRLTRYGGGSGTVPRFNSLDLSWSIASKIAGFNVESRSFSESALRSALDDCHAAIVFDGNHWSVIDRYRKVAGVRQFYEQDPAFSHAWHHVGSAEWERWERSGRLMVAKPLQAELRDSNNTVGHLEFLALGEDGVLITDPLGARFGVDPKDGNSYEEFTATRNPAVSVGPPEDILSDAEFEALAAVSAVSIAINRAPIGTYVLAVSDVNTSIDIAWQLADGTAQSVRADLVATTFGGIAEVWVGPPSCAADLTGDGVLNFDDIDAFVAGFLGGDLIADLDGNGVLNFDDIDAFVGGFLAGCG
ncbi:MAG: GC-type dockerin domain-anchored protein [Phycisphaerales bacterium]